jgi:XTP/dITP diphosphohydrolase
MKPVYFITGNTGKLAEAQAKLSTVGIEVIQKNLGYPEIQAGTLEEVARFGVEVLQKQLDHPFFLEDAGLFIESLKGFPGVYSSYVYHTIGCEGVLHLLQQMKKPVERRACFQSVIAYGEPGQKPMFFRGECMGQIAQQLKGEKGFGFDPIFIPIGETRTFAQMETTEKNCFSHRGKALNKLLDFFKNK